MGMVDGELVAAAGRHLMAILGREGEVVYGERFYDGTRATRESLARGMGLTQDDEDWNAPEIFIDVATVQLERAGLVATARTGGELADGEPDFRIALTEAGRAFIAAGKEFGYGDAML